MKEQPTLTTTWTATQPALDWALRPRLMQQHLSQIYPSRQHQRSPTPCHIVDAKVEPGVRCTILYQMGERLVIGELSGAATHRPETAPAGRLPEMQIYDYEHDPALPSLPTVLDGQAMVALLNTALPDCTSDRLRLLRCRVTPLRYRLGKRCTLRFDLRLRDHTSGATVTRTFYGKLYHSERKAQAVYAEMKHLSAALAPHQEQLILAQAVAFLPSLPLILQAPVAGTPLELLLRQPKRTATAGDPRAVAGIRQAAAALARLHQVAHCTERVRAIDDELVRFQERSRQISTVVPSVGAALLALANALPAGLERLPAWGAESSLVHGDCKPSQFLLTPASAPDAAPAVALLDFDHCGVADPAADVGNFLATLRQLGVKQSLKQRADATESYQQWLHTLEEHFLAAYVAARPCHPAFRQRAVWYQAVALLRKAIRSFSRSPRSPLPTLLAQAAWRCLAV